MERLKFDRNQGGIVSPRDTRVHKLYPGFTWRITRARRDEILTSEPVTFDAEIVCIILESRVTLEETAPEKTTTANYPDIET